MRFGDVLHIFQVDGIYPEWPIFVRPIRESSTPVEVAYSKRQEAKRKYIERFFIVMQAQFQIFRKDTEYWDPEHIVATT